MFQVGQLVTFLEEVQIKRCFWEEIERVAEIKSLKPDGTYELAVRCVPPKTVYLTPDNLALLPTAEIA
jgi:hypothetical protein